MSRRTRRNLGLVIASLLLLAGMVFGGLFLISATTSAPVVNNTPVPAAAQIAPPNINPELPTVNLTGSWETKNKDGVSFTATITESNIRIIMNSGKGSAMIYWNGTFEAGKSVGDVIVSDIDDSKAVLSNSKTKNFTVGDKTISFSFTAMSITKTVDLHRV